MQSIRTTRAGPRWPSLLLAASLVIAACDATVPTAPPPTASPTPAPSPAGSPGPTTAPRPPAEVYAEIREQVEAIRGLQPTKAVEPVTLDEAQLRTNITAEFDRENTPAELALAEDMLITLGLLPDGADLREIMLDFQTGQVAGYYSPDRDELYVVSRSGGLGPAETVTYAHEFTHQLQDQNVDLGGLGLDAADQSDRQVARLSLVEGDAVSVQLSWMLGNLTPEQMGELLASALDPKALEALNRAPAFVRETALFPYEQGQVFVTALLAQDGYDTVDAAYAAPPDSTEQVLHPEKFLAREAPTAVAIPATVAAAMGPGWSAAGQDTLGELILGIWLRAGGVARADSLIATAGWGGDRAVILRGPDGAVAVGFVSTWDSVSDAAEFQAQATLASAAIDPGGVVVSDGIRTVVVALGDDAAALAAALAGSAGG